MPKGKVRIYGCGGMGINLTHRFNGLTAEPGQAEVLTTYVDTSMSNVQEDIDPANLFLLKDVDGSGKVRRDNHEQIGRVIKQITQQHTPGDFNLVVFSASGGSGSVIGPLILSELLERGLAAIAIVVGSSESNITATNTLNTLKSLDAICKRTQVPVVIHYSENTDTSRRSDTDHSIWRIMTTLTILNSRENKELDTKDVLNWVQFQKSTKAPVALALLEVYESNAAAEVHQTPITIASLYKNPDEPVLKASPEYHTAGYPTAAIKNFEVLHYVIDHAEVELIAKSMTDKIAALERQRKSRVNAVSLVTDQDKLTDDGMVL